ncbi:arylsulfatase [Polaribacter sp. Q13]|uniref:sulfatase family protein n=1 Tax=Polaribacter sp. Q13 TaxID=2806551 RepID=UPI00193C1966|nr:arylsulfatase [Polaribacter sp. Q13]QVY66109.1 arylsulfatase [Polaribacter sp. Q13]
MKFKLVVFSAILMGVAFSSEAQITKKPNIIVVLADDVGVGDISHFRKLHKGKIVLETPNIDTLASEGMYFTQAHAPAALCATSRYSIMTGNNNYRSPNPWGVWSGYAKSSISKEQLTLGRVMQKANYKTAFFGKWHLGTDFASKSDPNKVFQMTRNKLSLNVDIRKIKDFGPNQNGFDYSVTLPSGIQNEPYSIYENDVWLPLKKNSKIALIDSVYMKSIGTVLDKKVGLGDSNWLPSKIGPILANKAVKYITDNAKKEKPFFMYYCSQAVHTPHMAAAELNGVKIAGTTPSKHIDMIKELDVQIGMMVAALKKQGVYDNTLIIFTSDNGGLHVDGETWNARHEPSDIYRGAKSDPYEGGHRVPFIAVWPNKIKANQVSEIPLLGSDILATIAAAGNYKMANTEALDSYNLLPILQNKEKIHQRNHIMIQGGTGKEVIIIEDGWKLIIQIDKKDKTNAKRTPIALFDLNTNETEDERFNFINHKKYQKKIQKLFKSYNQTRDSKIITGLH